MQLRLASFFMLALVACFTSGCTQSATLSQKVSGFHRPESCVFGLDGKSLYVVNVASGTYGPDKNFLLVKGAGFVSKLSMDESGQVKLVERRFVKGLDAPLGIAALPKATAKFPRGTLFLNVGYWMQGKADGTYEADASTLGTGVLILDPETGKTLGYIPCGLGSAVAKKLGFACFGLNGACFDAAGNFYAAECGAAAKTKPARTGQMGIVKLSHDALDALATGQPSPGISFQRSPHHPNGVGYRAADDSIYFVTCGGVGAIFRVPCNAFPVAKASHAMRGFEPFDLDGIAFTPAGSTIVSRMDGPLMICNKEFTAAQSLPLGLNTKLENPSDIKIHTLPDGTGLLAVPEQAPTGNPYTQSLYLFRLPAGR